MEPKLKADIWVKAYVRRCAVAGAAAFVVRRGDPHAGIVLVKLNPLDGTATVFSPARLGDGTPVWMRGTGPDPVEEGQADAYIERQVKFDPDLWVVEVEDRQGRHFLDEVEDSA